jgi:hypothetical protein
MKGAGSERTSSPALWGWISLAIAIVIVLGWVGTKWIGHTPNRNEPRVTSLNTGETEAKIAAPLTIASGAFAGWRYEGVTIQGDAEEAPDGTKSATKLTEDATENSRGISAIINIDLTRPVSASVSARQGEGRRLLLYLAAGSDQVRCDIDLGSGAVTAAPVGAGQVKNCAARAEKKGWWRVELTGSFDPAGGIGEKLVGIAPSVEPFKTRYQGNGHSSIVIWNQAVSQ